MLIDGVRVIAPSRYPDDPWSEAEVLGGCIWLWNQHPYYRQGSVESAMEVLSGILASRQFCFFVHKHKPLGYVNWAFLSEADAHAYMHKKQPYHYFLNREYPPGTPVRLWILSWFFPTGDQQLARRLLHKHVLKDQRGHFLYHRAQAGTVTVKFFSGAQYTS